MTREPREKSIGDIYHITTRGIGKQIIFENDADKMKFINLLASAKEKGELELLAWCLMDNHIHLLNHGSIESATKELHRVLCTYAMYFNWKYERVGHLF